METKVGGSGWEWVGVNRKGWNECRGTKESERGLRFFLEIFFIKNKGFKRDILDRRIPIKIDFSDKPI